MSGSITYSCGCTNPDKAYLVEYEGEYCDAQDGFTRVQVTASMCELHAIRQFAGGDVTLIKRIEP